MTLWPARSHSEAWGSSLCFWGHSSKLQHTAGAPPSTLHRALPTSGLRVVLLSHQALGPGNREGTLPAFSARPPDPSGGPGPRCAGTFPGLPQGLLCPQETPSTRDGWESANILAPSPHMGTFKTLCSCKHGPRRRHRTNVGLHELLLQQGCQDTSTLAPGATSVLS